MSEPLSAGAVENKARSLIGARSTALGIEITTPIVYPDGDCVLVIVAQEAGRYLVHDVGIGSMKLSREGIAIGREMRERLVVVAARYDCLFHADRMSRSCSCDEIATSIMLVANASRTVGDIASEARRQSENSFRYVLTERVREIFGSRLKENEVFRGQSRTAYRVANTILDESGREPVAFVVPLASRSAVASQFRELYDLRAAFPNIHRGSVYDEASDFRPKEDGWVLNEVGQVIPFGQIQIELPRALAEAPPQQPPLN